MNSIFLWHSGVSIISCFDVIFFSYFCRRTDELARLCIDKVRLSSMFFQSSLCFDDGTLHQDVSCNFPAAFDKDLCGFFLTVSVL